MGVVPAEQVRHADRAAFALELIVLRHRAAEWQAAAACRHLLDMTAQLELIAQQAVACGAIGIALAGKARIVQRLRGQRMF
jgi:hypothetical protein